MQQPPPTRIKRKAEIEDSLLLSVIKRYFKYAGAAVTVWGFGYFQFSPAWILLGLVIVVWKEKHTKLQQKRIEISQQASKNEKEAILARIEDLPSWVFFPDVERADWVNKMITQMWPFIGDFVQELLMTSVQKIVQDSASMMGSFKFLNIDLGDIPPHVGGVKVYTEKVKRDEIYLDLDLIYSSDCNIEVMLKGVKAGIKDLQLHGNLRVIFRPLLGRAPFFGSISVFFLNNPSILFDLTSLANALDLPGLNDMLYTIIQENIANVMVLPNRIVVPMVEGLEVARLKHPQPAGVLRIHVIEAKELMKADISVLGKGKSDPYAVVVVGALKFKTHVIENTLEPQWNSVFETIIDEKDGQYLDLKVKDEDTAGKSDQLGSLSVDLSSVAAKGRVDSWFTLEKIKSGKIHLKLDWLYLSKDFQLLTKTLESNKSEKKDNTKDELSSCILMVNLDSAKQLPRSRKMSEPSAYVILTLGQKIETSNVVMDSTDPRWEQAFRFLVQNPNFQTLDLKVMDKKTEKEIGVFSYLLKNLLSSPDMVDDRYFQLKKCEGQSEISLRLALRVLTAEQSSDLNTETENLMTPPVAVPKETILQNSDSQVKPVSGTVSPPSSTSENSAKPAGNSIDDPLVSSTTADVIRSVPPPAPSQPIPPAPSQLIPPAKSSSVERDTELRQRIGSSSTATLGAHRMGRIQVTLKYNMQNGKLIVTIHKCVGLLACGKDKFSDPYVKLYLLPEKSIKKKTKVINNNLNPVFEETFEFSVTPQELPSRALEIMVRNDTGMFSSSQQDLGGVHIDLAKMDLQNVNLEWYDLAPEDVLKSKDKLVSSV